MESCPDEDDVAAFVRGELQRDQAHDVERHLDGCQACSTVVAELVRIFDLASASDGSVDPESLEVTETERSCPSSLEDEVPALPAGAEVGRYKVLECIGIGGMGVVYGAYDPELDRKVALKLLRRGLGGDQERRNARLRREAQAMAKLADPNVIAVHDVGLFDGRVFIAMEFVDGTTLGKWMRERPRRFKEVHTVFSAAGAGLAAAHEAGLVHRDFKPDNVLIGFDGRVRVTDFGLASFRDGAAPQDTDAGYTEHEDHTTGSSPILDMQTLTKTGMLVGTPAYMSPEAYSGRPVTAASDQFSFCVALYEAVYGERPFEGTTLAELATNVTSGSIRPVRDAAVPSRVRELIRRGLAVDPKQRFASMRALLAVLSRRPSRTARRWAATFVVPSTLLVTGLWWSSPGAIAGPPFCQTDYEMDAVWNGKRRAAVRDAFGATALAWAPATAEKLVDGLDDYAVRWTAARDGVCAVGEREGALPGQEVLTSHCLLRQRARVEGLIEVFEHADDVAVGRSLGAVDGLPDPARCAEEQDLSASRVPDPPEELQELVAEFREQLERAYANGSAGRYDEALAMAIEVDEAASALGFAPLYAEAHLHVGRFQMKTGQLQEARETLEETAWIGVEAHTRATAAQAWIELVFLEGARFGDFAAAHRAMRAAEAEVRALGDEGELRERLLVHGATLAIAEGRNEDAMRALQSVLTAYGDRDAPIRRADLLFNIAGAEAATGQLEDAEQHFREYIAAYRDRYGQTHPAVASGYFNLATSLYRQGRLAEALVEFRTSAKIEEASVDPNHPRRADSMGAIGAVLNAQGRPEEAVPYFERAVRLASQPNGSPSQAAYHGTGLAEILVWLDRLDDADAVLAEAKAQLNQLHDPTHAFWPRWHIAASWLARRRETLPLAMRHAEQALEIEQTQPGPDPNEIATCRVHIAEIAAKMGDRARARTEAEAVIAEGGAKAENKADARKVLDEL